MEIDSESTGILKKDGRRLLVTLVLVLLLMAGVVTVQQKYKLIERVVAVPEVKFNESLVDGDLGEQGLSIEIEAGEEELIE